MGEGKGKTPGKRGHIKAGSCHTATLTLLPVSGEKS